VSTKTDVTFRNMEASDALATRIREHAAKLEHFYDGITRCEVVVELPHRHHSHGRAFHVRVELHCNAPGAPIIVSRDPGVAASHEDPYIAVRDAFATATRQLHSFVERLRGEVKRHDATQL
jgi:ribosome-associated translation inhibitor RaiA